MKTTMFSLLVLSITHLSASVSLTEEKGGWVPLFNGKDLTGLKVQFHEKVKDGDPSKTFLVKDSVLVVTGKPKSYIYTEKSYKDYVLTFDWRFPEGSSPDSNSGCLVHIQPPYELVMPKSVEPQGRYKDHGKLFFVRVKGEETFDEAAHKKALKPMGEWSTTEVTCKPDGTVSVKLNGIPVSQGKTELTSGPIGFQCEGWEIHFRNIKIKENK